MTQRGTVIDGKYEILKEIGRGGMSIVYLAMDNRLNKQWAVKEIRKRGNGKKDEIVVNSLLAEANLMKRLDHPALPRIVDIIDNGVTIYVIMDYIEGESLDKILEMEGPQEEDRVIEWAMQLCDALGYLHSQKPPIIYRDMKPANVMLKPDGNIKIIDFGIAREYKEEKLSDTTVLGTKGYAPPEQYSGQTDARSDIYALGMTMHHLLTGNDPRTGNAYVPIRQYNPELSEGVELIINKCVEPAPEKRYQSCSEMLYDLEHPDLITSGYKKKQRKKLFSFIAAAGMAALMAISGLVFSLVDTKTTDANYAAYLAQTNNAEALLDAVDLCPDRPDAYQELIDFAVGKDCTLEGNEEEKKEEEEKKKKETSNKANKYNSFNYHSYKSLSSKLEGSAAVLDKNLADPDIAKLYYEMGRLIITDESVGFKERAANAVNYYEKAARDEAGDFGKKDIAKCYAYTCALSASTGSRGVETSKDEYEAMLQQISAAVDQAQSHQDSESNYDVVALCYTGLTAIGPRIQPMASSGVSKDLLQDTWSKLKTAVSQINSTLPYVTELRDASEKLVELYDLQIDAFFVQYEDTNNNETGVSNDD